MKLNSDKNPVVPFLSFKNMHEQIRPEVMQAFERFYDKGLYILGDSVNIFEREYSKFNSVQRTIGTSNGLDALHLCLRALNVGKGDEVIVPSNTFIATVLAVSYVGATPVFVEPDVSTYNIDTSKIDAAITKKTKAIIPVHLYGQACNMEEVMKISNSRGLFVVEDNAQAQGAAYKGQTTGSIGHLNATSFYPGKNLGALGDAGAVTTNDISLADKVEMLRNYGSNKKYYNDEVGFNMRLDELQATILSIKLKYLREWTSERIKLANLYDEALRGVEGIILPHTAVGASHVYHLYVIRTKNRDRLQDFLSQNGIGSLIHYPIPPHLQQAYKSLGFGKGDFPIAEEIAETCLSLPLYIGMTEEHIFRIAQLIKSFV